jgi:hypothetical protein
MILKEITASYSDSNLQTITKKGAGIQTYRPFFHSIYQPFYEVQGHPLEFSGQSAKQILLTFFSQIYQPLG